MHNYEVSPEDDFLIALLSPGRVLRLVFDMVIVRSVVHKIGSTHDLMIIVFHFYYNRKSLTIIFSPAKLSSNIIATNNITADTICIAITIFKDKQSINRSRAEEEEEKEEDTDCDDNLLTHLE